MNVALSRAAGFPLPAGKPLQDHHGSGIVIGPTLDYLERAYLDARTHGWSREPVVEMLIPSTLDSRWRPPASMSRASSCSTWRRIFPMDAAGTTAAEKEAFADLVIDTVTAARTQLRADRCSRARCSRRWTWSGASACSDGDIFHGAAVARPAVFGAPRARPCRLPYARLTGSTFAAPARIPAAASPAFPATMPPARSFVTSSGVIGGLAADEVAERRAMNGGRKPEASTPGNRRAMGCVKG